MTDQVERARVEASALDALASGAFSEPQQRALRSYLAAVGRASASAAESASAAGSDGAHPDGPPAAASDGVHPSGPGGRRQPEHSWAVDRLRAQDVMTTSVVSVPVDAPFAAVVDALTSAGVSAVPVVDADGAVVGVVSEQDLLAKLATVDQSRRFVIPGTAAAAQSVKARAMTAGELMSAPAIVVGPEDPVPAVARLSGARRVKRLPVVDDRGRLVGIVSRADLVRLFLRTDQEIADHLRDDVIRDTFLLDPLQVRVDVDHGVVTLRGELSEPGVLETLLQSVSVTAGVVHVDSHLTSPTSTFHPTADEHWLSPWPLATIAGIGVHSVGPVDMADEDRRGSTP
ncbi:CBS domain-containing protein [Nakamurella panacisegetis]|nr:CBS domain-containing protein [Nakamurella panacisegetis]